jgi:glucosyl-3-phosphoglycerate synthase
MESVEIQKVESWLQQNTFHCFDYKDFEMLYNNKNGRTISLVMPTLNEEDSVGAIIETIFRDLNNKFQLIDELVLIDGGSTDNTLDIVHNLETKYELLNVVKECEILPDYQCKKGKGNQLWKGLYCSKGTIVLYCDSDLKNFDVRMIYGLIGPLLTTPIKFVKGFYERPLVISDTVQKSNEGGRVTELCARPMLNLLYPELSGFIQPLGGEYGGYREVLENVEYMTGYGVEVNMLIDILEKFGLKKMGQVDLLKREHRHQNTNALSKMSFIIMNTILRRNMKKQMSSNLLMKNFTQVVDSNFKNNVTSNIQIGEHFKLIDNAHDEPLPPLTELNAQTFQQVMSAL